MRRFLFWFAGLTFLSLGIAPADAQADILVQLFRGCTDGSVPLPARLTNCKRITNAQGLGADDMAFAYVDLGLVYQEQHDDDAALVAFNKALTYRPTLWQGLVDRAFLYLRRNAVDLAVADYQAVRAGDPNETSVVLPNVGEYRQVTNGQLHDYDSPERDRADLDEAVLRLRNAVARALGDRCVHAAVAASGVPADCSAALDIAPDLPAAFTARGFVEFVHGDFASAVGDLEHASPDNAPAIYLRGVAKHRLGANAQGDLDIAAAEKLKPGITSDMTSHGLAP